MEKLQEKQRIRKCAKALYLVGDIGQMMTYLDAVVESGKLTEEEADSMSKSVIWSCTEMTMGELKKIRNMF